MAGGLAKVTISAPGRRLDIALPERVPLAELLPEVLRHAGDGLADDGERHGGWVLRRADGAALSTGQALLPQGVRDGELLFLVPARVRWAEPEYDDVVEAIAEQARGRGAAWSPRATRVASLAAAVLPLALGLFAAYRAGPQWSAVAFGGAALLLLAGTVAARAYRDGFAGAVLAGCALPYAFVASTLAAGLDGPGQLLAGCAGLLVAALAGAAGVAAHPRVFVAGATAGLLGGLAALAGFALPADGAAAILFAALACGAGVPPLLAIRLGRLPLPPVGVPDGTPERSDPGSAASNPRSAAGSDPDRVRGAVARTEELITGMLAGQAVLAGAAAALLVAAGGPAGRALVAAGSAALLLRSRLFVAVRQRLSLMGAGLAGFAAVALALTLEAGGAALPWLAAGGVLAALVTVAAGAAYAHRPPSPYLGRAADLLDILAMVAVVPIACAVLDLYGTVRDLTGQ